MKTSPKLTAIELLAIVAVAAAWLGILSPTFSPIHPNNKAAQCASNLHGIAQAMYIYAQDDPQVFPAIAQVRAENDGAMRIFDPEDRITVPSTTGIPSPTVDMWTVVRSGNADPEEFICPFTKDDPDPAPFPADYYDFLGPDNLSYAYQYQHDPNRRVVGPASEPSFPVLADGNPYIKGGITQAILQDRQSGHAGNSKNHKSRKKGQNVLFVDGSVDLEPSPDVGLFGEADPALDSSGHDNVYTVHEAGGYVDPGSDPPNETWCNLGSKSDACLVP